MNGTSFIMWTTEEGGYFKATKASRKEYEDALVTGKLILPTPFDPMGYEEIDWFFIAFGTVEHNWDKGLGESRY